MWVNFQSWICRIKDENLKRKKIILMNHCGAPSKKNTDWRRWTHKLYEFTCSPNQHFFLICPPTPAFPRGRVMPPATSEHSKSISSVSYFNNYALPCHSILVLNVIFLPSQNANNIDFGRIFSAQNSVQYIHWLSILSSCH